MNVNALECPKCKNIIFSRASHDFRRCSCESTFIDGGFDYMRFGHDPDHGIPKSYNIELAVQRSDLYHDYNYGKDKYGCYKDLASLKRKRHFVSIKEMKNEKEEESIPTKPVKTRFESVEL